MFGKKKEPPPPPPPPPEPPKAVTPPAPPPAPAAPPPAPVAPAQPAPAVAAAPAAPSPSAPADGAMITMLHAFGEIALVLASSPARTRLPIDALNWLVGPPLAAQQFRIFQRDGRAIAVALWAMLSEEAEARLLAELSAGRPAQLQRAEWTSGDRPWLIELIVAENAQVAPLPMIEDLARMAFPGRVLKMYAVDNATGQGAVREVQG